MIFGYEHLTFFKTYLQLTEKTELNIAKLCYEQKQPKIILEKYFPELYKKIDKLNAKYFSTKLWMFLNNGEQPTCKFCRKTIT